MSPHFKPSGFSFFAGTPCEQIALDVCRELDFPLSPLKIEKFSDGEIRVELLESVRGKTVVLFQSTCSPSSENIMELLHFIDAAKRADAQRIVIVFPYFGYGRRGKKLGSRSSIGGKLVADIITTTGADHILALDLHAPEIQGFFRIPVDNLSATSCSLKAVVKLKLKNPVYVSPDLGGANRTRSVAESLGASYAVIDRTNHDSDSTEHKRAQVIGEVKNRDVVIVDDLCDSGATLTAAASLLKEHGARRIVGVVTHGVFSVGATEKIESSALECLLVSNSIPLSEKASLNKKIKVYSVSSLLAKSLKQFMIGGSITGFKGDLGDSLRN